MATFAAPDTSRRRAPHPAQRVVIGAGALLAILGAAWGAGAFGGTPIQDAAGGALAADATLLAPATPAFGIWSVIYTGLAGFAVLQAIPRTGSSPRLRRVAWLVLVAMALNAAWIAVVQAGEVVGAVGVLAAIVAVLGWAAARLTRERPDSWIEAALLDVPVGLYLGWAAVATVANVAAAGSVLLGTAPDAGRWAAVGALVAVLLIAVAIVRDLRPSTALPWSVALAMIWGTAWIGVGRLEAGPLDAVVGWTAIAVAATIACAAWLADVTVALARRSRLRHTRERELAASRRSPFGRILRGPGRAPAADNGSRHRAPRRREA
ncbi:hypothetical protein [Demequina pelophila]|uniref:hypothetical protein n=1 Tax=Demequina pelophila TaxID=1638984 RepID=UPI000781762A|nr:hypothetical protein [Demequina pelophila]